MFVIKLLLDENLCVYVNVFLDGFKTPMNRVGGAALKDRVTPAVAAKPHGYVCNSKP